MLFVPSSTHLSHFQKSELSWVCKIVFHQENWSRVSWLELSLHFIAGIFPFCLMPQAVWCWSRQMPLFLQHAPGFPWPWQQVWEWRCCPDSCPDFWEEYSQHKNSRLESSDCSDWNWEPWWTKLIPKYEENKRQFYCSFWLSSSKAHFNLNLWIMLFHLQSWSVFTVSCLFFQDLWI